MRLLAALKSLFKPLPPEDWRQPEWKRHPGTFPLRCEIDGAARKSTDNRTVAVYECGHQVHWDFTPAH